MFYHFSQNNSGGGFDFDEEAGITHHVIIEADSADHANKRAQTIGIYFDGVYKERDCPCCGDRWSDQWSDARGSEEPKIYGTPVADSIKESIREGILWMDKGKEAVVHYADGRMEWF